jgi:hypothetical protein
MSKRMIGADSYKMAKRAVGLLTFSALQLGNY